MSGTLFSRPWLCSFSVLLQSLPFWHFGGFFPVLLQALHSGKALYLLVWRLASVRKIVRYLLEKLQNSVAGGAYIKDVVGLESWPEKAMLNVKKFIKK